MKIKALLFFLFATASFQSMAQIACGVDAGLDVSLCPGDSTALNATVSDPTVTFRYFWSPSAGLSDTSIVNPVAKPTATTTYQVEITRTDAAELVVNGNFSQGNQFFTSEYTDSVSVWNGGTYSINTSPQNVHPGFSACNDHTTGSSQMMVVNGASTANVVIWEQTIPVTPNTEYEYSTWVINALANAVNLPELQFSINDQLIGPVFTSSPLVCEWTQFFTTWHSDTSTTATIKIINQSVYSVGNDFAIDDISFKAICRASDSLTVTVFEPYDPAIYGLGNDTISCDGNPITLGVTVPNPTNIQWQDGSSATSYSVSNAGVYTVSLQDDNNCLFTDTVTVRTGLSPQVTLPADTTICSDNIVTFNVYDPTATEYLWRGPSVYFLQNDPRDSVFTATFPGVYEVDVVNECGTLTQLIELKTEDCTCKPFIPNGFTPNNDGDNDKLYIFSGCEIESLSFSIFDRWGGRVFYTEDINQGWDGLIGGQLAAVGAYVFKLEYTAPNFKGEVVKSYMYGDISLIR